MRLLKYLKYRKLLSKFNNSLLIKKGKYYLKNVTNMNNRDFVFIIKQLHEKQYQYIEYDMLVDNGQDLFMITDVIKPLDYSTFKDIDDKVEQYYLDKARKEKIDYSEYDNVVCLSDYKMKRKIIA